MYKMFVAVCTFAIAYSMQKEVACFVLLTNVYNSLRQHC